MCEPVIKSDLSRFEHWKRDRPFFNARELPEPSPAYVCWLDVMGADSAMRRSTRIAANFVMKLHAAALEARTPAPAAIALYPAIDGVYIISPQQRHTLSYLKDVMRRLALTFVLEDEPIHRFMLRGGVAFGPVARGDDSHGGNFALLREQGYRSRICIGMPLPQAFSAASRSSPFGIYIHESVRTFAPDGSRPLAFTHWPWWTWFERQDDTVLAVELKAKLLDHLEWCSNHHSTVLYPSEAIDRHRELCREYFRDVPDSHSGGSATGRETATDLEPGDHVAQGTLANETMSGPAEEGEDPGAGDAAAGDSTNDH